LKQAWTWIQTAFAAFGGWLGWVLGGFDGFLYALIMLVVIDYITGLMVAVIEKRLSSELGFKGLFKKILIFAMVAIAHLIDDSLIGGGEILRTVVIFFYAANEGISVLENASRIGLPIPEKLKEILLQLHKKSDAEKNKEKETKNDKESGDDLK
jgi:toxin secretion/phage lysis holin